MPNNKKFLNFFLTLFVLLNIFIFFYFNSINLYLILLSVTLIIIRFIFLDYIYPINIFWYKIGFFLSKFTSPIILGLIYFILITPIAIFMRIINFDPLKNGKTILNSAWVKQNKKIDFKRQF
tara:strand:- start:1115 stop:1480 length:366 start_codon:yes stop_codon:yes gene_type:complete